MSPLTSELHLLSLLTCSVVYCSLSTVYVRRKKNNMKGGCFYIFIILYIFICVFFVRVPWDLYCRKESEDILWDKLTIYGCSIVTHGKHKDTLINTGNNMAEKRLTEFEPAFSRGGEGAVLVCSSSYKAFYQKENAADAANIAIFCRVASAQSHWQSFCLFCFVVLDRGLLLLLLLL